MYMKLRFNIIATIWRWPSNGGWHFVTLDKKTWSEIRTRYPKGMIKIEAKIGKHTWLTSLLPHKESKSYLIAIKSSVRKSENIFEGDTLKISFRII